MKNLLKKNKINNNEMLIEFEPTQKEKNIFFAGISLTLLAGITGSLFIGSFFRLTEMQNYSPINMFLIFMNSGLALLILMIWFRKQIKSVRTI